MELTCLRKRLIKCSVDVRSGDVVINGKNRGSRSLYKFAFNSPSSTSYSVDIGQN